MIDDVIMCNNKFANNLIGDQAGKMPFKQGCILRGRLEVVLDTKEEP